MTRPRRYGVCGTCGRWLSLTHSTRAGLLVRPHGARGVPRGCGDSCPGGAMPPCSLSLLVTHRARLAVEAPGLLLAIDEHERRLLAAHAQAARVLRGQA